MRTLVMVCDGQMYHDIEAQHRREQAVLRRRARYARYRNKCNSKIENCNRDLALSIPYDGSRLEVRVQNPLTLLPTNGGRYTTYEIAINTNNIAFNIPRSYVRRRYSDFTWLRTQLCQDHNDVAPPKLPPKRYFGGQFELAVIEERIRGLTTFLEGILCHRVYLSSRALHLFVQSDIHIRQIESVLSGRDKTSVSNHILEASRLCASSARCFDCREEIDSMINDTGSLYFESPNFDISEYDIISMDDPILGLSDGHDLDESGSDLERCPEGDEKDPLLCPDGDEKDRLSCPEDQKDPLSCPEGDQNDPLSCVEGDQKDPLSCPEGDQKDPFSCSTPQRSLSDSALVLSASQSNNSLSDISTASSSSRPESSSDSPDCASGCPSQVARLRKIKPSLSQSLPMVPGKHMQCGHRRIRRVTFSSEVTVAEVLESPEDNEDGKDVALVQVHKDRTMTK